MVATTLPRALTPEQKLRAFHSRFYDRAGWVVKAGDLYTTTRSDLELYVVLDVKDGVVTTGRLADDWTFAALVNGYPVPEAKTCRWREADFVHHEFGPSRLWVPPWALDPEWKAPDGWRAAREGAITPEVAEIREVAKLKAVLRSLAAESRAVMKDSGHLSHGLEVAAGRIAGVAERAEAAAEN